MAKGNEVRLAVLNNSNYKWIRVVLVFIFPEYSFDKRYEVNELAFINKKDNIQTAKLDFL